MISTRHWLRRLIKFLVFICILCLTTLLILHVPFIQSRIASYAAEKTSSILGASLTVESLSFNLATLNVRLNTISISAASRDTSSSFDISRIDLNISLLSLLRGVIRIENLTIDSPDIILRQSPEGGILLPFATDSSDSTSNASDTPFAPPPVILDSVHLKNARIRLLQPDQTPALDLRDLSLDLTGDSSHTGSFIAKISSGSLNSLAGSIETNPIRATITCTPEGNLTADITLDLPGLHAKTLAEISPFASPLIYHATLTADLDAMPWLSLFHVEGISASPIRLTADARNGTGHLPVLNAEFSSNELTLQSLLIDALKTTVSIDESSLLHANSLIQIGAGLVDSSLDFDLNLKKNLSIHSTLSSIDLKAIQLPDSSRPLSGVLHGSIVGSIPLSDWMKADAEVHLSVDSAGIQPASIHQMLLTLNATARDGHLTLDSLSMQHDRSRIDLSGHLEFPDTLSDVVLDATLPDVTPYLAIAGLSGGGAITLRANASGALKYPSLTASGSIESLTIGAATIDIPAFSANFDSGSGSLILKSPRIPAQLPDLTIKTSFSETLSATLESSDHSISGSFKRDPSGSMVITSVLTDFSLDRIRSFIPAPGNEIKGNVSATASIALLPSAPMTLDSTVSALSVAFRDHRISLARPVRIQFDSNTLSVSPLDIISSDGSTIQATVRSFKMDGPIDTSMQLNVPDLASWRSLAGIDDLNGTLQLDLNATGMVSLPVLTGDITGSRIEAAGLSIDTLTTHLLSESATSTRITSDLKGLRFKNSALPDLTANALIDADGLTASLNLKDAGIRLNTVLKPLTAKQLEFDLEMDDASLERYADLPPELTLESHLSGHLKGNVPLDNPLNADVDVRITRLDLTSPLMDLSVPRPIRLTLAEGMMSVIDLELSGNDASFSASGELPLAEPTSATHSVSSGLSVKASLDASAAESFQSVMDHIAGRVDADVRITGSAANPVVSGHVLLSEGILDSPDLPSRIEKINGKMTLDQGALTIEMMTARFAEGQIELKGRADCFTDTCPIDFSLRVRGIDSAFTPEITVALESDLSVLGTIGAPSIRGEVKLQEALYTPKIDLIGILNSIVQPGRSPGSPAVDGLSLMDRMTLDINVLAPDAIRIENPYLELDLGARLQVIGTAAVPGVMGTVSVLDGYLDLLRTEFEIDRGSITFTDPWQIDPEVDINATAIKGAETIYLKIAGRASRPILQLSSSSGLTHTEIVKLLAGVSMPGEDSKDSDLTGLALQYAANSAALILADFISAKTGLILIPFPTGSAGEHFLFGAGKRIGERVLIMYYRSLSDEGGDAVEFQFDLTQHTKLRARQNQDGSTSGGVRYRYEFH